MRNWLLLDKKVPVIGSTGARDPFILKFSEELVSNLASGLPLLSLWVSQSYFED